MSAFQESGPCDVCGEWPDECKCPPCKKCGDVGNPDCYDNHDMKQQIEDEKVRHRMEDPWYVNVYMVDRAYGGPEEGGWWYDCGDVVDCFRFDNYPEARAHLETIEKMDRFSNEGRRPISSVLSDGQYQCQIEDHLPRPFPSRRPHYE